MPEQNFTEWLQELKYKANIVDVVRSYTELNRKGSNYWACCPFHHEKTPSFCVNDAGQFFHCFGCDESGDVIKFVQQMESQDFMGAVRILAEQYNMQVPEFKNRDAGLKVKKDRLYGLLREAGLHYHNNLKRKEAESALQYLDQRGLDQSIIKKFGIGYSLDFDSLIRHLKKKGFNEKEMLEAGVAEERNKKVYDALHGRLIIPIINPLSQIIAFGGRVLQAQDFAKYKNTKETPVFVKNRELFGLNLVKKVKQQQGLSNIIIVEGYMDVISLNRYGIQNAVASMGTALTEEQAKLIKRFCDHVYICYDGDSAGQKATLRGLSILKDAGLKVQVITMEEGLDPDDYIKANGTHAFLERINAAIPLTEYKIKNLAAKYKMSDAEDKSKFVLEALKIIKELDTVVEREVFLPLVKEASGVPFDVLQRQLYDEHMPADKPASAEDKPKTNKDTAYYKGVRFILYSMFSGADYARNAEDLSPYLNDTEHKILYDFYRRLTAEQSLDFSVLYEMEENEEAREIVKLQQFAWDGESGVRYFDECFSRLKSEMIKKEIELLSRAIDAESDAAKRKELLTKMFELQNTSHK